MQNILTWDNTQQQGAIQKNTHYGNIYSDLIFVKPELNFSFTELYYNEVDLPNSHKDNKPLSEDEKIQISNFLLDYQVPKEWLAYNLSGVYQGYLNSTEWYIIRFNDPSSGKAIPQEVLDKRAICRNALSQIRECETLAQLEALMLTLPRITNEL